MSPPIMPCLRLPGFTSMEALSKKNAAAKTTPMAIGVKEQTLEEAIRSRT